MPVVPPCCSNISIISYISITHTFEWNVLSYIQISKTFEWEVGEGPLYWFQVDSYPVSTCPSYNPCDCGYIETQTIMATGIDHLCERLRELGWNKRIRSVQRWAKPALVCDVEKGIRDGIDYSCNSLISVDFCVPECMNFISGLCGGLDLSSFVWYTEYGHLNAPSLNVGDKLILGQKIATVDDNLHFGVGDGQVGGNIGQTLNIDFGLPTINNRPVVTSPNANTFTNDQIDFIVANVQMPVNSCNWEQDLSAVSHSGYEYYAIDMVCEDSGHNVYNASGGLNIDSEVVSIQDLGVDGWLVVVRHTKGTALPLMESFAVQGQICSKENIVKNIKEIIDSY